MLLESSRSAILHSNRLKGVQLIFSANVFVHLAKHEEQHGCVKLLHVKPSRLREGLY